MSIKVLFLPLNYGSATQDGWYNSFREAGCQLEIFDYMTEYLNSKRKINRIREAFIKKVDQVKPDLLFMQIQHTNIINGGVVKQVKQRYPKMIVAQWSSDSRSYIPKTYKDVSKYCDFNFIPSTGQLEKFRKEINNVHYLQIGYNPELYYPEKNKRTEFNWDCIFIAHYNAKEKYPGTADRIDTVNALRSRFGDRFCLYGDGWSKNYKSLGSIDQKTVAQAYHKSKCVISVSHFNNINHYFSDRLLMAMASGRPTVQMYFPQYESYFTNNCDLVIAKDAQDIADKAAWLVNNPDIANFIGESGAAKVFAEHTYLSRVNELLDVVGVR